MDDKDLGIFYNHILDRLIDILEGKKPRCLLDGFYSNVLVGLFKESPTDQIAKIAGYKQEYMIKSVKEVLDILSIHYEITFTQDNFRGAIKSKYIDLFS